MPRHRSRALPRRLLIALACTAAVAAAAFMTSRYFPPARWVAARSAAPSGAERLGRAEVLQLLNTAADAPLTFEPFQGQRRCCDLGEATLHFHRDGTVVIDANGFVLDERVAHFQVGASGELELLPPDASIADWLRKKDVGSAEIYRYGTDLYLVKAGSALALPPARPSQWPFRVALQGRP